MFFPSLILALTTAVSAASIYARVDVPDWPNPVDCVPYSYDCIHVQTNQLATVLCSADGTTQVCQRTDTGRITELSGRPCSNATFAPNYPITNACVDVLEPYDASKIPGDCSTTMCSGMDGAPNAEWCLYFQGTGMQWRRLQMECAPGASPVV